MMPGQQQESYDLISILMQDGTTVNHEVFIRSNGDKIHHLIVMVSGISRGAENDKSADVRDSSPLWLDCEGVATVRCLPTGMGRSEGDTFQSCLRDRIEIIKQATLFAVQKFPGATIALVGGSMGGHVAVRAASELIKDGVDVNTLFLSSPCFYSDAAEVARYGEDFRRVAALGDTDQELEDFSSIRQLEAYPGRLFVYYQEHDGDVTRGGVPDIGKISELVSQVMMRRKAQHMDDVFFVIADGEHAFKSGGVNPDKANIATHSGSANKQLISEQAAQFLGLEGGCGRY